MREYTAEEILAAREERVDLIGELRKRFKTPLLVMRVNYPGLKKTNNLTVNIIEDMSRLICAELSEKICWKLLRQGAEGPIVYLAVDKDVWALKTIAINFEEKHSMGRCLDLDVYDLEGRSLGRKELGYPGRKCYLCEDYAQHCVRARRHSEGDVIAYIEEKYRTYRKHSDYRKSAYGRN
ncbi:MAG: citrate lyase holo-[acyl-carrier protein] synthase [Desulfosporosinus sp.]|nr:citrate lyase holo-[acyl-carrier protein] synthase [Desulfosporosinus sp.]